MRKSFPLILFFLLSMTACGQSGGPGAPDGGTPDGGAAGAEPNVVKGRVLDLQGDPVPNATITVSGYTGTGANVVERAVTDAQGAYRLVVPAGLYDVDGEVELAFDGQTFHLYLHPAGGGCHPEDFSENGLIRDFTFRIEGFIECPAGLDPGNQHSWSGGTVGVQYAFPQSLPADAVATFVLTPQGPRADGSQGETITVTRTIGELANISGTPGETRYLYDLPLGRYTIAGSVALPGGGSEALRFGHYVDGGEAATYEFGFEAVQMWPYGIRVTNVSMYDAAWPAE